MKKTLYLTMLLLLVSFASAALTDDLLLYTDFDSDYNDGYTTNNNNSWTTQSGTSSVAGILSNGLYFDNAQDYICMGDGMLGGFESDLPFFTTSFWLNSNSTSREGLLWFGDNDDIEGSGGFFYELRSDNGQVRYASDTDAGTDFTLGETNWTGSQENGWQLITVVFDAGTYKVYKNGTNTENVSTGDSYIETPTFSLCFGGFFDSNNSWVAGGYDYNGYLDELAFWNRSLTSDEVETLYNSGTGCNFVDDSPAGCEGTPVVNFFTVIAYDNYGTQITSFNSTVNGSTVETTNGSAISNVLNTAKVIMNVTIQAPDHFAYFNDSNINTTDNHQATLYRSEMTFQAITKITNEYLNSFTVNDSVVSNTTNTGNATLNLVNGTVTIDFGTTTNFSNYTTSIEINNLDNYTHNLTIYNHTLEVYPVDFVTNVSLSNFIITVTTGSHSEEHTTENSNITLNLTTGVPYNITINVTGYATNTTYGHNISGTNSSIEMFVFKENSVYIRIYNEETGTLINDRNVSVEFISDSLATSNLTDTGALIVEPLIADDYRVRYSATNYPERLYFVTVVVGSTQTIDVYLLNETKATNITVSLRDEKGDTLEGAYIKLLRYYLSCNCYKTVEMTETNFVGQGGLRVEYNDEFYKFIIDYDNVTYLETTPFKITNTLLNFQIALESVDPTGNMRLFQDIAYNLTFNNETDTFRYTFSDTNNVVRRGCLETYIVSLSSETIYNTSCVNSSGATLLTTIVENNGTTYKAVATIDLNEEEEYVDTLYKTYGIGQEVIGLTGVLLTALLVIVFALISVWNPSVSAVLVGATLIVARAVGLISLGLTPVMAIIGVVIIIVLQNQS